MYCIQHCFICRPSDSTVSEDAGIEPRTVATSALAVRRSNQEARSPVSDVGIQKLRFVLIIKTHLGPMLFYCISFCLFFCFWPFLYLHNLSFHCIFLSISGAGTYQWIFQQVRHKMKVVGPYKLSHQNKPNIIQKRTKNVRFFITFIPNHRAVVKQDHIVWHICWVSQTPFCDTNVAQCTVAKQHLKSPRPWSPSPYLILYGPPLLKSSTCIQSSCYTPSWCLF